MYQSHRSIFQKIKLACLLIASLFAFSCSTKKEDASFAYHGKYKAYSEDPNINRFVSPEDNYIQLNQDKTIVYNTTINQKPKFRFKGTYSLDEKTKAISIKWEEGKLPSAMKIEEKNDKPFIRIGETVYIKQEAE